jgi:DNA-binding NarL/FixJ family response regulator
MDRILITDDHPLVRNGIRALLSSAFPTCELHEAASLKGALEVLGADPDFDLVTLDLDLPDAKQLEALTYLRARFPSVPIAVLSASRDAGLMRLALASGASGFISKSETPEHLVAALQAIRDHGIYVSGELPPVEQEDEKLLQRIESLTPQQRAVLGMIVAGLLNKQIAHELNISLTTVKAHVSALLAKLGVVSRTQAALLAKRLQIFP